MGAVGRRSTERTVPMTDYGLVMVVIAVVVILATVVLGHSIAGLFNAVAGGV
jgi:Flp pilus assembly pilin Flp